MARNPPACPAEKRSLIENLVTDRRMPCYAQARLHSEARRVSIWFVVIPPASTKLKGGYTGITLSVCPSVDRIVSALYLQQYSSDPFHICTSYQATSEGVSRVMPVSKFKNLFSMDSFHI